MAAQRGSAQRKMPSGKCFLVGSSLPKKVVSVFIAKSNISRKTQMCSASHDAECSVTVRASGSPSIITRNKTLSHSEVCRTTSEVMNFNIIVTSENRGSEERTSVNPTESFHSP